MTVKKEEEEDTKHLSIWLQSQDGGKLGISKLTIEFRVKNNAKFQKIITHYCNTNNLDSNQLRFSINGEFISKGDRLKTVAELNLENNDIVEVHQHQQGGQ